MPILFVNKYFALKNTITKTLIDFKYITFSSCRPLCLESDGISV